MFCTFCLNLLRVKVTYFLLWGWNSVSFLINKLKKLRLSPWSRQPFKMKHHTEQFKKILLNSTEEIRISTVHWGHPTKVSHLADCLSHRIPDLCLASKVQGLPGFIRNRGHSLKYMTCYFQAACAEIEKDFVSGESGI